MQEYIVKQGDCINSIAYEHGFFPGTIWDHPKNASLKQQRIDPNVLYESDVVFIPDKKQQREVVSCDKRSSYKLKGVPARLLLKIYDYEGKVMANALYKLDVDGNIVEGNLNSQGILDISILPSAKKAVLVVGNKLDAIEFEFKLGYLNPIDTLSGIKARLNDLGFDCGEVNEESNDITEMAIRSFQKTYELEPVNGKVDNQLIGKLKEIFGL
jgi:hypothetical protein